MKTGYLLVLVSRFQEESSVVREKNEKIENEINICQDKQAMTQLSLSTWKVTA